MPRLHEETRAAARFGEQERLVVFATTLCSRVSFQSFPPLPSHTCSFFEHGIMRFSHRCVVVGAAAAVPPSLRTPRRGLHHSENTSTCEGASVPSSSPPLQTTQANTTANTTTSALQCDDTEAWLMAQVQRSVASGRQTQTAADYFSSMLHDQPEFHHCLKEARRLMGGQEPERLTRYQQGQFADHLCTYVSGIASEKMRRAHAEETTTKRYTQDGTPTGENYWFEAGNTLSSPSVPAFVKDEILHDMQKERSATSPAFERPPEEAEMAGVDDGFAAHLRRQRSKLLRDADFK